MNKEERLAKAKLAMKDINKTQKGVVINFASDEKECDRCPTGIKLIDDAMGGGFPHGKVSVCWGDTGTAKTTLMYYVIAQAQRDSKIVAFFDLENSFNSKRAEKIGVILDDLIVIRGDIAEESLDIILKFAREKIVDVCIIDSIHSMAPKLEIEDKKGHRSVGQDTQALLARKLAQFFRMVTTPLYKANIACIFIGQTRTNLGGYIALQTLSGGKAIAHASRVTFNLRRGQKANAPFLSHKEAFLDPDGKFHLQTKKEQDGFECILKIDSMQVSNGFKEGTAISVPFYYNTSFTRPDDSKITIIIDPKMNEEQVKIIKSKLVEKGYEEFNENVSLAEGRPTMIGYSDEAIQRAEEDFDPDNNCAKDAERELEEATEKPEKKKRGRPKGKKGDKS